MRPEHTTTAHIGPLAYVRFASEVAMLLGLAFGGAWIGNSPVVSAVLAVTLPAVAGVVWGLFVAPRARRRLEDPARLAVELALVLVTAALLVVAGHWVFAVVVAALYAAGTKHGRAGG
jgi:hypothetical protein